MREEESRRRRGSFFCGADALCKNAKPSSSVVVDSLLVAFVARADLRREISPIMREGCALSTSTQVLSPDVFQSAFERVFGLILEEWPTVNVDALKETGGDFEKVTALVAETSGRTRALVKRQLGELVRVIDENGTAPTEGSPRHKFQDVVDMFEKKSRDLLELAKGEFPEARAKLEEKVEENLWTSLLIALGLGFILGLLTRGGGR
jgi:ElaB/YqjD/DUF883 family membrane-anchored ribosome-binding protein